MSQQRLLLPPQPLGVARQVVEEAGRPLSPVHSSCSSLFLLRRPSELNIQRFLDNQAESGLSYPFAGYSATESALTHYTTDHTKILLGHGENVWKLAVRAVDQWQMFSLGWVELCWPVPIAGGVNVAVLVRHFGFWSLNAARIVYTISESGASIQKYGFAYGTLLDHAESGEERFSVEWQTQDDAVWYDLLAFSRPRSILAKLGYPFTRWLQYRFRRDSLAAMLRAVQHSDRNQSA